MTLQNLLKIQSLIEFKAQREDVQRVLACDKAEAANCSAKPDAPERGFAA